MGEERPRAGEVQLGIPDRTRLNEAMATYARVVAEEAAKDNTFLLDEKQQMAYRVTLLQKELAEAITAREEAEQRADALQTDLMCATDGPTTDEWMAMIRAVEEMLAASEARATALERALREVLAYTPISSRWKSEQDIALAALSTPEAQA